MTADSLARRLAEAAAHTAARRRLHADGVARSARPDDEPTPTSAEPLAVADVPTGWWAYGRTIWPLGDDITDDRILIEGTDRRSYAALNHYLRDDATTAGACHHRGRRRDIPTITEGRVSFERAGDAVRVTTCPEQVPAVALVAVLIADRAAQPD